MAGDWIKLEHATPDKPEIVNMSSILKMDQDAVFGKCVRLWIWADQQTVDGNALSVTEPFIDRLTFCPGFAAALRHVGWLSGREGRLMIPNFDRHNGQTAKNRAQTKARVERSRSTQCNATSVTESLPEKRREEKNETQKNTQEPDGLRGGSSKRFKPPTIADVAAFATAEQLLVDGKEFVNFYSSKGWRVGSSPMKDWHAAARNWSNRRLKDGRAVACETGRGISAVEAQRQSVERMLGKIAD
jgi:hypothetical protein